MQKLFEKHPNSFKKGATHTTRKKRPGEIEGVKYYYVSKEEFLKLKDNGGLVENNFYNNNLLLLFHLDAFFLLCEWLPF